MELIENKKYDEERALYNIEDTEVKKCIFASGFRIQINVKNVRCQFKNR